MRLLFVADGRSPIARNWIRYFAERGDEVYLASTFACDVDFPLKRLDIVPVAFSALKKNSDPSRPVSSKALGLRTRLREWFGPLTIFRASRKLRALIEEINPDLIHAMRIPYEGMMAADAYIGAPLIVSVWGNDFTLHALSTPMMRHYTDWTLKVTDALHADCNRDIRLAHKWGLKVGKPTLVVPGSGGIRTDMFYPPELPTTEPIVVNPRGFRSYVCNEAFFKSIPLVLAERAEARFICSSMAGESQAIQWMKELGIEHAVRLNPPVPYTEMAKIFRAAQVVVSPSMHDGTPNSLIEGMACGCFPIAGDLESIREWIIDGQNGLLVDPTDPQSIAKGVLLSLERKDMRRVAAGLNTKIISARAEYTQCMKRVEKFYESVIKAHAQPKREK